MEDLKNNNLDVESQTAAVAESNANAKQVEEQTVASDQTAAIQERVQPTKKPKINGLRTTINVFLKISNVAFAVTMGYLLFLLVTNIFGLNLSPLFGNDMLNELTLGLGSAIGIFIYAIYIGIIAGVIALLVFFIKENNAYCNVLKTANEKNKPIFITTIRNIRVLAWLLVVSVLLLLITISLLLENVVNIASICLAITTAAMVLSLVLVTVYVAINRIKYWKLAKEDRITVKNASKVDLNSVKKKENKKTAGKLY